MADANTPKASKPEQKAPKEVKVDELAKFKTELPNGLTVYNFVASE